MCTMYACVRFMYYALLCKHDHAYITCHSGHTMPYAQGQYDQNMMMV